MPAIFPGAVKGGGFAMTTDAFHDAHWVEEVHEFLSNAAVLLVGLHLAGVALTTDWPGAFDRPADILKGGVLLSGMYDLEPVSLSSRREYVRFDEKTVAALSPQRHIGHLSAPVIVAYGTLESPEFQRQSRDFADAIRARGKPVELIVAENYNHFEILETLANPFGQVGAAALRQIGLS